jgi:hypothetical protein
MALRTGHGRGRGVPRIEVLPPDELPPASPANAARVQRSTDGRFTVGNTVARSQRVRPGPTGLVGDEETKPAFRSFASWGRRYASHRRGELAAAHGGAISAGVGALVESSGLALAASRYLHAEAAKTGDGETFKRAVALADSAKSAELAAWELASREGKARPPRNPHADLAAALAAEDAERVAQRGTRHVVEGGQETGVHGAPGDREQSQQVRDVDPFTAPQGDHAAEARS